MFYHPDYYRYSQDGEYYEPAQQSVDTIPWDASTVQRVIADTDAEYWEQHGLSMGSSGPLPRIPPSDLAGALGSSDSTLPPVSPGAFCTYVPLRKERRIIPQHTSEWEGTTLDYVGQEVIFAVRGGDVGISLAQASSRSAMPHLENGEAPWFSLNDQRFSEISSKISLRIDFDGYPNYTRQIMSLRATRSSDPIALREMARKIAQDTKKYLEMHNGGVAELRLDGSTYGLGDIFLFRLRRISKGSWRPEYYIERH
ncbi:hypothetical protein ACG7TL_002687 [Trametes sanguinea]